MDKYLKGSGIIFSMFAWGVMLVTLTRYNHFFEQCGIVIACVLAAVALISGSDFRPKLNLILAISVFVVIGALFVRGAYQATKYSQMRQALAEKYEQEKNMREELMGKTNSLH